ncbi:MAG: aminoacyl-tRNA hydrolase [Pseudomonadota bacterium]
MIVLVGLGNPGKKHARHRHNVGFKAADRIADRHGFGPAREKFQGALREGILDGPSGRDKALILKPQTYMNESGRSVGELVNFYKLAPEDVVVFYDELDLVPGKLKVKKGGGAAGHNGIRSIDAHIGNDFRRVRIGIGHPGDKSRVTNHVLGDFSKADHDWLDPLLDAISDAAPMLVDSDQRFATAIGQMLSPAPKDQVKRSVPRDQDKADTRTPSSLDKAPSNKAEPKGPLSVLKDLFKNEER